MDLKALIQLAEEKKGGRKPLAEYCGLDPQQLTDAKAHRRPLPDFACVRLANLLEIPPIDIIAASALATEKNPERRAVWIPFVERIAHVAHVLVFATVTTALTATEFVIGLIKDIRQSLSSTATAS